MGIETPLQSMPAEAIGGLAYGVTPLEQADGYATLANGGIHHDPTAISKVEFPDGKVDEIESESGERVLTTGQAYDVTNVLKGVITQGTGAGYTNLPCSEVAGKTGTSEEESDAWFVGYTPEFSTAVWVGHPQSRETTGFGGPTAGPIWRDYMEAATSGKCPAFETPSSLPELSALTGGHTASGGTLGPLRRRRRIRRRRRRRHRRKKKAKKKPKKSAGRRSAGRNDPRPRGRRRQRRLRPGGPAGAGVG